MGRIFGFVLCLGIALSGAPALAEEAGGASAEKALEERIRELEEKRAKLVEERDAARMRANVYVLPQDKLMAQKKQEEIDEVDREIARLKKEAEAAAEEKKKQVETRSSPVQ
ncbi:MAG: hypothetical protein DIU72_005770 [Pseudomonadota bacterium]|nr:MAG: hypothetical protein DIU72_03215 [Pseudomonadota bacterium]